jgi:dihydropteroate synthase
MFQKDWPLIMAIINVTPDSFYSGSRVVLENQALILAEKHISEGADILDIGGMSTRPGAEIVTEQEELDRVLPVIAAIKQNWPEVVLSIDTYRAPVASAAVASGAALVNDVSAGALDSDLLQTVAKLQVPYILMHMQGTPQTMQIKPEYESVTSTVHQFFEEKLKLLRALGIKDIWLDPGFGFGKTVEQNFQLLRDLEHFTDLDCPLLVGLSRKSMIYKTLGVTAEEALNGTTALHMAALMHGAQVLRVHDVGAAHEVVRLAAALK